MKKFFTLLVLIGLLTAAPPVWADEGTASQELSADQFIDSAAGRLFRDGDYEGALQALESMLKRYPNDPLIRRYQGITLDRLGRSEEAIVIFTKLLKSDPEHVPTHYFLGQAYARQGKREEALREWRWVQERGGDTPYAAWAEIALHRSGEIRPPQARETQIRRWHIQARYGYEYDSNVILRPADDSLASSKDHNAGRQNFELGLRYRIHSTRDEAVDILYAVRQSVHDDGLDDFNFHSEEFSINARKRVQIGAQDVVLGLRYEFLMGFLETDLFSVRNRFILSGDTRFTAHSRTVFYDRFTFGDFAIDGSEPAKTSRDGIDNDLGVTHYIYSEDFRRYVFIREEFGHGHTRGTNFDTVGLKSRLGVHTPLAGELDLDASVGYEIGIYHNFTSISTRDSSRRRNHIWDLYASLSYPVTPRILVIGFYRYINADNQNNFFDYNRHIGGAQVVYSQLF